MNFQPFSQHFQEWGRSLLPPLIGVGCFLAFWQFGAMGYSTVVLPSPLETWAAVQRLAIAGKLSDAILVTCLHLFSAFTIAVAFGIVTGVAAGLFPRLKQAIAPLISGLQGIPPIGWIVLALLWFGSGPGTPIFTIAVAVLPIVFLGTLEGIQAFPDRLAEMARAYRVSPRLLFLDLYFPHLISYLFPALAAGLGLGWRVAVMAELLASETGIGAELNLARINLDTDEVMAWIAIAVLAIWASEYLLLRPLRRWLEPWRVNSNSVHSSSL